MKVRIQFISPDAKMPRRSTDGSIGYDCTSVRKEVGDGWEKHYFGFKLETPKGYLAMLAPRSSIVKTGQIMGNGVTILDNDYRGEVSAVFYTTDKSHNYYVGDRVAQLVFLPCEYPEIEEADSLTETARGEGGYGSTGR